MLFTTKVLSVSAFSEKFTLGQENTDPETDTGEKSFSIGEFPTEKLSKVPTIKEVFMDGDKTKVLIFLPNPNILLESELNTYRQFANYDGKHKAKAISGRLLLESKSSNLAIAEVLEDGSEQLKLVDPSYNHIMAGDPVMSLKKVIRQKIQLVRNISLQYRQLFKDPTRHPSTFELTEEGKNKLRENLKKYNKLKISTLFIQSFVDHLGDEMDNLVESKQRAEVVKTFLVTEMGYDETKLVPIAMGELEPEFGNEIPGSSERNRRITFQIGN